MNVTEYIPAAVRKPVYGTLAVAGLVIGSAQVAYASVDVADPEWLTVSLAVLPFVAAAVGFTAQGNTTGTHRSVPEGDSPDEEDVDTADGHADYDHNGDEEDPQGLSQEDLEALAAAESDDTPPPEGYEPRH